MNSQRLREALDEPDPRLFYWFYGALVAIQGIALIGWGPVWLGANLAPAIRASVPILRLLGAMLIAAGCFAAAVVLIDDPLARRRAGLCFAAAHAVVLYVLLHEGTALWGADATDFAAAFALGVVLILLLLFTNDLGTAVWRDRSLTSLFGLSLQPSTGALRSRYERQIREAAVQEERNRLARDLHDSIKQQVFAIQTAAATAQVRFDADPGGSKAALEQVRASAREAMIGMEAMLDQLRAAPLENLGLVEALKKQCEALSFRLGVQVDYGPGTLPPSESLSPGAHEAILRIAQEALANVGRHSRAAHVQVTLDGADGNLKLIIADDGVGFDSGRARAGMGMANMRQRAAQYGGNLQVSSRPGGGTTVTLSLPDRAIRSAGPGHHLAFAVMWGVIVVLSIVVSVQSTQAFWFAVCFLPMCIREAHLYVRARRRRGAA